MKVVIDIPYNQYAKICAGDFDTSGYFKLNLRNAFRSGTLLPKGHGRLIDADALQKQAVKVKLEHVAREIEVVTINQIKEAAAIPIIEGDRKCNQCAFYKGVHNVKGHAPCSKMGIPGVLWNDTCNQFREAEEGKG